MRQVFGKKTVYVNDIGCYTLGYGTPLHSCDLLLCMGASISMAAGFARMTGQRTVAYIGDSTFYHSGLPALANAVQNHDPVTVCILNNSGTAMTGFQPSPLSTVITSESALDNSPTVGAVDPLEQVVRGLGVTDVRVLDPYELESGREQLKQARDATGPNVVIFNSPCRVYQRRLGQAEQQVPYFIEPELCDECSLCVRLLGCPSIFVADGEYAIDQKNCDGCGLCARVCNKDAIRQVSENVQS